jgi:hypothetical protein
MVEIRIVNKMWPENMRGRHSLELSTFGDNIKFEFRGVDLCAGFIWRKTMCIGVLVGTWLFAFKFYKFAMSWN